MTNDNSIRVNSRSLDSVDLEFGEIPKDIRNPLLRLQSGTRFVIIDNNSPIFKEKEISKTTRASTHTLLVSMKQRNSNDSELMIPYEYHNEEMLTGMSVDKKYLINCGNNYNSLRTLIVGGGSIMTMKGNDDILFINGFSERLGYTPIQILQQCRILLEQLFTRDSRFASVRTVPMQSLLSASSAFEDFADRVNLQYFHEHMGAPWLAYKEVFAGIEKHLHSTKIEDRLEQFRLYQNRIADVRMKLSDRTDTSD